MTPFCAIGIYFCSLAADTSGFRGDPRSAAGSAAAAGLVVATAAGAGLAVAAAAGAGLAVAAAAGAAAANGSASAAAPAPADSRDWLSLAPEPSSESSGVSASAP
jgi:hypothetical protein